MRKWLLFLTLSSTPLFGQSQQTSPLNPAEKRQILLQLYELQSCRGLAAAYEEYAGHEKEQGPDPLQAIL